MRYIMAIDQGTTGTKVVLFDAEGHVHSSAGREITQYYPKPDWVSGRANASGQVRVNIAWRRRGQIQ